jgi:lipid-A-disaccharide synthase
MTSIPATELKTGTVAGRAPLIFMVAGEPSGDAHGAELIQALQEARPGLRIIGAGGPKMAASGQEQLFDLASHAVLGLVEVIRQYFKFRGFRDRLLELARRERPDAVVLIDCSGFNLRLAPHLRRDLPGTRIIYYISPQVWASRAGRVRAMQRDIDLLISILPFEKAWFARVAPDFKVQWVGHPALDRIRKIEAAEPNPNYIALLPGSRRTEIEKHLPVLWSAAALMAKQHPGLRFILLSPNEDVQHYSTDLLAKLPPASFDFELNVGYAISHLSRCGLAIVASGTASLECALVGIPQVVIYRVNPLTFAVGRRVVKVKHLSIVNVMANERVVPEFLQDELEASAVAQAALDLLLHPQKREAMKRRVAQVVATLGEPGASRRAAEAILLEAALAGVDSSSRRR